jgi:hypothetical protein
MARLVEIDRVSAEGGGDAGKQTIDADDVRLIYPGHPPEPKGCPAYCVVGFRDGTETYARGTLSEVAAVLGMR